MLCSVSTSCEDEKAERQGERGEEKYSEIDGMGNGCRMPNEICNVKEKTSKL